MGSLLGHCVRNSDCQVAANASVHISFNLGCVWEKQAGQLGVVMDANSNVCRAEHSMQV